MGKNLFWAYDRQAQGWLQLLKLYGQILSTVGKPFRFLFIEGKQRSWNLKWYSKYIAKLYNFLLRKILLKPGVPFRYFYCFSFFVLL